MQLNSKLKERIDDSIQLLIRLHERGGTVAFASVCECNRVQSVRVANYIRSHYKQFAVEIIRPDIHFDSNSSGRWEAIKETDFETTIPTIFIVRFK